ncbi:enoyl-CoA delta isomerase 2-like [Physella acuta]|uniref:enoyl-CoA delta isomerase 2-like n=1 Tax=Physella acuta TaxID=109671 RepID=UPI0027DE5E1D|nr:enoyl-CoA delta isomerase 2-like [Physella acuta]
MAASGIVPKFKLLQNCFTANNLRFRLFNLENKSRLIHTTSSCLRPAHDKDFEKAKERLNKLKEEPGNDVKLKIYGLFKQATQGKCNVPKPGMMDLVGKAKWSAWNELGSMSQDDAQKAYINLVDQLAKDEGSEAVEEVKGPGVQYEGLKITRENKIFHIQLNRPKKKNAITWQMYKDIGLALKEAAKDDAYSIAVITGAGDFYCSGNDLSNFANVTPDKIAEMANKGKEVLLEFVDAFIEFPKPIIALVNGPAVGISVTTLALCDVVYATDLATFHTPFSQLGQSPEACSSYTFPKIMGYAKASELLLFNKKITAYEAKERNLIADVFPNDVFLKETTSRIQEFAKCAPQSIRLSKVLNRSSELQLLKKVNKEECELLEERWQSKECTDAILAFFTRKS